MFSSVAVVVVVTRADLSQYCGEFDNWGAIMSVSAELLCSFELLKPLDSSALKNHIKKGRNKRNSMLNSPVSCAPPDLSGHCLPVTAGCGIRPELLNKSTRVFQNVSVRIYAIRYGFLEFPDRTITRRGLRQLQLALVLRDHILAIR